MHGRSSIIYRLGFLEKGLVPGLEWDVRRTLYVV